ncbi:MAG TPA: glycosyltransferase [Edaphocola sp.]|nr:glycosyltransferase [Edaphocola sp.]
MMEKISIAMATYNGEKFLREQLDSILVQSWTNFELIICDDCSTDKTTEIIAEYQKKDARIKFFQNTVNLGFKKNFERIITLCTSDFIALCDQDDIWTIDHLKILYENIGDNDCIGANSLIVNEKGISQNKTLLEYWPIHILPENADDLFYHELYSNMIQGSTSLIRSSLIKKALPIPENIKYHDYWFALIAGLNGGTKYISDVILMYRRHSNNASAYQLFSIINAVKDLYKFSKSRKDFYSDSINLLQNLMAVKNISDKKKEQINQALVFYTNLSNNTNKIKSIYYYIKNYNLITLSKRMNLGLFLYRLFGLIIFGIKA